MKQKFFSDVFQSPHILPSDVRHTGEAFPFQIWLYIFQRFLEGKIRIQTILLDSLNSSTRAFHLNLVGYYNQGRGRVHEWEKWEGWGKEVGREGEEVGGGGKEGRGGGEEGEGGRSGEEEEETLK